MTIENTDPEFPWITNYVETLLSQVWYPCTVATQSREMKKILLQFLKETGDPALINFKLHDFGERGSTSMESAGIGGMSHLVNFKGTDTMVGLVYARDYYYEAMAGFSCPAAEHSTMTIYEEDGEEEAVRHQLEAFHTGLLAIVGDSYNIYNFIENVIGTKCKELIVNRRGVTIVRPDSGTPSQVVCDVLRLLGMKFSYTMNVKGFKVLPSYIRVIQGDGIDIHTLQDVLVNMKNTGWSTDNIAFGSGGGLLQKVNRDTWCFAFKCSHAEVNGASRDVYKKPTTDSGKTSKRGRLVLLRNSEDRFETQIETAENSSKNLLIPVYENGKLLKTYTFDEVRQNAAIT